MKNSKLYWRKRLLAWRGVRLQRTAAALLGISLHSYKNWELGRTTPPAVCGNCIRKKMDENP